MSKKGGSVRLADMTEALTTAPVEVDIPTTSSRGNVVTLSRDDVKPAKPKHTSLYLPSETTRAIREIALQFDKKPHDLYIEGINLMLARYGKAPVSSKSGKK